MRDLSLSSAAVVVENDPTCSLLNDPLGISRSPIGMLASKGCSAVLLTGDVTNLCDRSSSFEVEIGEIPTESSLWRKTQSSPVGRFSEPIVVS
jgi:hypothetical protein